MPYLEIKDAAAPGGALHLHYVDEGAGEPLIMLHGLGADSFEFIHQIEGLRSNFRCIALDQRGFGLTPATPNMCIRRSVDDVDALADHLGLKSFNLLGHSMGTMVSMVYAANHQRRVKKLILVDGSSATKQSAVTWFGLKAIPTMKNALTHDQKRAVAQFVAFTVTTYGPRCPRRVMDYYLKENQFMFSDAYYANVAHYMADIAAFDFRDELLHITSPTLIIHGALDLGIYLYTAFTMLRRIKNSRIVIMPMCGHSPNIESPDKFNRILKEFLSLKHGFSEYEKLKDAAVG